MGAGGSVQHADVDAMVDHFVNERVGEVVDRRNEKRGLALEHRPQHKELATSQSDKGPLGNHHTKTLVDVGRTETEESNASGSGKEKSMNKRMPSSLRLKHQTSKTQLVRAHTHSMSLRALALRHYSRQENEYIQHEALSASFLEAKASAQSLKFGAGSANSSGSAAPMVGGGPGASMPKLNLDLSIDVALDTMKKKPNLKIQVYDDPDWVQVSDDEDDELPGMSPRFPHKTLTLMPAVQQSYLFTKSGTIFVDGFHTGIGTHGIRSSGKSGKEGSSSELASMQKLPMRERLVVLCKLGTGASSIVYKAFDISDMQIVALKMVPVYDRAKRRQMVRELSALFSILKQRREELKGTEPSSSNPVTQWDGFANIVRFFDAFSNLEDGGCALCMEYMDGGSLQDVADAGGVKDEATLASIARQSLEGLNFLHACNFIHRDIKPGNILIDQRGAVKVSDLGILRKLDPVPMLSSKLSATVLDELEGKNEDEKGEEKTTEPPQIPRAHTFVGTAVYMAPERIDGQDYTVSSDVWSLGLALLTVALGKLPIDQGGGYWGILNSIRDSPPPNVPDDGTHSDDFRDFIACMLKQDPDARHTCNQLLEHPFIVNNAQTLEISTGASLSVADIETLEEQGVDVDELSTEHYVAELQTILFGLYSHLVKLKADSDVLLNRMTCTDSMKESRRKSILVEVVKRLGAVAAMRFLLLGSEELGPTPITQEELTGVSTLASQINLSPERTVREINQFCAKLVEGIEDEVEDPLEAQTPKARHA
jgi:serine/threonine protein kinase